jgi:hypothetical protein
MFLITLFYRGNSLLLSDELSQCVTLFVMIEWKYEKCTFLTAVHYQ